jgi:hypothetical protein
MEDHLWKKIPVDLFINHIAPYSYQRINESLLNDIRNFTLDYRMIINYYYFDMNEHCLLVDLLWFCNRNPLSETMSHSFIEILNRNVTFKQLSLGKKYEYIQKNFYYNICKNTLQKNKFILALLTPSERAQFINEYIIEYYE